MRALAWPTTGPSYSSLRPPGLHLSSLLEVLTCLTSPTGITTSGRTQPRSRSADLDLMILIFLLTYSSLPLILSARHLEGPWRPWTR